jgi:sortase A
VAAVLRALNYLGRALITAGVILLLFVAYQLWGTGLHTSLAQDDLEDQMVDLLTEGEEAPSATTPDGTLPGGEGEGEGDGEDDPSGDGGAPRSVDRPVTLGDGMGLGETYGLTPQEIDELPAPELSESAGYISIPEIGSNWWYVEGVDLAWLRDGPGHFPNTSWPGQAGNAAFAGHRTTYGAPFHRVDELEPGDEILVETPQGEFTYEVMARGDLWDDMDIADRSDPDSGHFIIEPDDSWILDDYDDDRITLMACHPKYSAAQRIVVVGELVGPVAPTTDPSVDVDDPGAADDPMLAFDDELIGNDPTARLPAAMWGLAAASVWMLAWQIGRTWRRARWPAYLLGTPVFLVLLFVCFTYVEQLLPAGF